MQVIKQHENKPVIIDCSICHATLEVSTDDILSAKRIEPRYDHRMGIFVDDNLRLSFKCKNCDSILFGMSSSFNWYVNPTHNMWGGLIKEKSEKKSFWDFLRKKSSE